MPHESVCSCVYCQSVSVFLFQSCSLGVQVTFLYLNYTADVNEKMLWHSVKSKAKLMLSRKVVAFRIILLLTLLTTYGYMFLGIFTSIVASFV